MTRQSVAAGTNLQANGTSGKNDTSAAAAYLSLHITPKANAYLEVKESCYTAS